MVKPKKLALRAAEEELEIVMKSLARKQAELQAVEDKLDALDRELKRMEKKKKIWKKMQKFVSKKSIELKSYWAV